MTDSQDDPGGLQWLWDNTDLPSEAFERMAQGGIWRIAQPPNPVFTGFMSPREAREVMERMVSRIAVFRGEYAGRDRWAILGQWEGQKEWWHVGWIEH